MKTTPLPVKLLLFLPLCLSAGCYRHVAHLPPGPVNVSGQVVDASGAPLHNNRVLLYRGHQFTDTRTNSSGEYTFAGLALASYLVEPWLDDCYFVPQLTWLHHLTASAVADFAGIGASCGGEPEVNMGGADGPYTVSGHVLDAGGQPVVGARIDLIRSDDEAHELEAVRFTDFAGSYSIRANRDRYELHAAGECKLKPDQYLIEWLQSNIVRDFTGGKGCKTASLANLNPTGSVYTVKQGGVVVGTTFIRVEQRASAADAQARLTQIVNEQPHTPSKSVTIAGLPAIERQTIVNLPGLDPDVARGGATGGPFLALTTAIVDGSIVVRYESQLAADASAATIDLFFQTARNFTPASVNQLHGPPIAPVPTVHHPPAVAPPVSGLTTPGLFGPTIFGELELGASDVANVVVYGTQNGPFFSVNGGQNINASTYNTANPPPATSFSGLGDPTVAIGAIYGASQQNIYFMQLELVAAATPPNTNAVVAAGLYRSTDNGATFNNVSFPVNCGNATAGCFVPDQEHMAADRLYQAVTTSGTTDQLYMTWRNYNSGTTNAHTIGVACSKDGGKTWTSDLTTLAATGGDFGRPVVGPDQSLVVSFAVYSGAAYSLQVQKWSSCASGFTPGILGTVQSSVTEVTNMPGLDRPANGNYAVAFDGSDGTGKRLFAVYSNEATSGNDDIHAAESQDGGQTWPNNSIVNTVNNGRRYFPWICSTVGQQFVTWYDRRDSTSTKTDLTAYYRSTVSDNGSATSVGIGTERNVSGVDDPQCASGFPGLVRAAVEESQCKNLPSGLVPGGTCQSTCPAGTPGPCGSGALCDFRAATPCTVTGETCTTGGGIPKFGDYNGSACSQGVLYMAWASSTAPTGGACLLNGVASSSASNCCSGQLSGGACAASSASCTPNGGACGGGQPACCSSIASNGQCVANTCLPAIGLYTSSSCIGLGCAGLPVTITYHQVGACNGFPTSSGITSAGPNAAFVFYRIESIDNSGGASSFNFDPTVVYVQQTSPSAIDTFIGVPEIFGPFAAVPATVNPGQDLQYSTGEYVAVIVQTTAADGATEADGRNYPLSYKRAPSDPPVTVVNSNPSRTSWPLTENCQSVVLE